MKLTEFLFAVAITATLIAHIAALFMGRRNSRHIQRMENRLNHMCSDQAKRRKFEEQIDRRMIELEKWLPHRY